LFGVSVNVQKILSRKNLAPCVEQPKTAGFCNFIEDATVLLIGQLLEASFSIAHGEFVVAMDAIQRTTPRYLNASTQRDPVF
jgi:hypothetical protein